MKELAKKRFGNVEKLSQVEDIYRPYQQKRKTRATDAIAKGLKPLAVWLLKQEINGKPKQEAKQYITQDVPSVEAALQGAKDIIAEMVSDDAAIRERVRNSMQRYGKIVTKERKNTAMIKRFIACTMIIANGFPL